MKASEFKKYQNYALSIKLKDLDHEINDDGYKWNGQCIGVPYTEDELNSLWDKEVISFDMGPSSVSWGNGRGPKILTLYVSRFTEEERRIRDNEFAIEQAKKHLERLAGKKVVFEDN